MPFDKIMCFAFVFSLSYTQFVLILQLLSLCMELEVQFIPICFVMAQSTIYHNDKYEFNKQKSACAVEMCHAWH